MITPSYEYFNTLINDYEENLNHSWFRKTKNILDAREPTKIYA